MTDKEREEMDARIDAVKQRLQDRPQQKSRVVIEAEINWFCDILRAELLKAAANGQRIQMQWQDNFGIAVADAGSISFQKTGGFTYHATIFAPGAPPDQIAVAGDKTTHAHPKSLLASYTGYERFTDRARKVMQLANQEAQRLCHEQIEPEHVLVGILKERGGVAVKVLEEFSDRVNLRTIRDHVKEGSAFVPMGKLRQSERTKVLVANAISEARALNHNYVGTEHLLLGLLPVVNMPMPLTVEEAREWVKKILVSNMP